MTRTPRAGRRMPAAVLPCLLLALAACGSGSASAAATPTPSRAAAPSAAPAGGSVAPTGAASASRTSVPGCAQLLPSGARGLAAAPVVTAAGSIPALRTFVQAVTEAALVDALDAQQGVTVLAPTDQAFQALPADRRAALLAGVPQLTAVLTHHVLPGRLTPGQLVGTQTTLDNDTVTVQAPRGTLVIPGSQTMTGKPAHVLCADIRTANATLYVIDQVLAPQRTG